MGKGRGGALAALAVSVVALALSVLAIAVRIDSPSTGATLPAGGQPFTADGVAVDVLPGVSTTVRDGDVVTGIAGRSTVAWAQSWREGSGDVLSVAVGDVVRLDVRRDGAPIELDVALTAYPAADVLASAWGTLAFVLVFLAIAMFVFWLRPAVPAAGALLVGAVGAAGSTFPYLLGMDPLDLATGMTAPYWLATAAVYMLLWAGMIDFFLVFPGPLGVLAQRPVLRLVPYVAVFGAYLGGLVVTGLSAPSALGWLAAWGPLTLWPSLASVLIAPIVLVFRWRRGPAEDRRILRAFGYVLTFMLAGALVTWIVPEALGGRPLVPWTVAGLTGLPLPILIAASIVRHGAFDIDVVLRRSLVYGGLTLSVIVVYAVSAAGIGAAIGAASPFATSLLASGLAAIVALPVRDGLQRAASRMIYGDRDEPVRAIRRLGERLELSVDPDLMPRVVVDTVADALRLPYVALELGLPPSARMAAERGAQPDEIVERTLVFQSHPIGRLLVGARGPADPLTSSDLRLLDDLGRQIGVAAHAALLTEDLRVSRERIVTAREEERRRLRRDLHDGLGPALAAIGMRAEAAGSLIETDRDRTEGLLRELQAEVTTAVADIRRLVDALRPPAIDEVGLVGALRLAADRLNTIGSPVVSIESDSELGELPAAVEVAAYRIGTEAMTNAVRHAGANSCVVRLARGADLTVVVEDDGRGLPTDRQVGVGITSMHDRAAELGGDCRVETRPGGGTTVVARLPLAPRTPAAGS